MPPSSPAPFRSALKRIRSIVRIVKGVGHKYLYKLPSGNAADPWKYFYDEASLRAYLQKKRSDPKRQRERIGDLSLAPLAGSDKAFLITGNTRGHLELMRNLKETLRVGGWNKKHGGWIFPTSRRTDVVSRIREYFQKTPPTPNETPLPSPGPSNALSEAMKGNQNAAGPRQNTAQPEQARRPLGFQGYFQKLLSLTGLPRRKLANFRASFDWAPGVKAQLSLLQDGQTKQHYFEIEYPSTTGKPDPNSLRIEKNRRGQWEITEYREEGSYVRGDHRKHTLASILNRSGPVERIVDQLLGTTIEPPDPAPETSTLAASPAPKKNETPLPSNALSEAMQGNQNAAGPRSQPERAPQSPQPIALQDYLQQVLEQATPTGPIPAKSRAFFPWRTGGQARLGLFYLGAAGKYVIEVDYPSRSKDARPNFIRFVKNESGQWDMDYWRHEEKLVSNEKDPGAFASLFLQTAPMQVIVSQLLGKKIEPQDWILANPAPANETPLAKDALSEAMKGNQNAAGLRGAKEETEATLVNAVRPVREAQAASQPANPPAIPRLEPKDVFEQLVRERGSSENQHKHRFRIANDRKRLTIDRVERSPRGNPAVTIEYDPGETSIRMPTIVEFEIQPDGSWIPYYFLNEESGAQLNVFRYDDDGNAVAIDETKLREIQPMVAEFTQRMERLGRDWTPATQDAVAAPTQPPRPSPPQIAPLAGMGALGLAQSAPPAAKTRKTRERIRAGVAAGRERVGLKQQQRINADAKEILARVTDGRLLTDAERETLRKYEGQGGQARNDSNDYVGKGLLYEFYTPQPVIDKAWELIQRYLPKGGRILEPAAGTGRWAEGKQNDFQFHMLEIDETSRKIATLLYPEATVEGKPFEKLFVDDRNRSMKTYAGPKFNAAVGNPPYGAMGGAYKASEGKGWQRYEEYFMHRSLDAVEEGGIVAMVVPSAFLRKGMTEAKERIFAKAELLEAYRLPNGSFAHTDIGTDLVILRKNTTSEKNSLLAAGDAYFEANPEHVFGEVEQRKNRFGELEPFVKGAIDAFLSRPAPAPQPLSAAHKAAIARALEGNQNAAGKRQTNIQKNVRAATTRQAVKRSRKRSAGPKDATEQPTTTTNAPAHTQESFNAKYKLAFDAKDLEILRATTVTGAIDPALPFDPERMAVEDGEHVPLYIYTAGHIREKLEALERNRENIVESYGVEQYERQRRALEAVLPPPVALADIILTPLDPFAKTFLSAGETGDPVPLTTRFKTWALKLDKAIYSTLDATQADILAYVDGEPVTGKDTKENAKRRRLRKQVGDKLFQRFVQEGLSEDERRQLTEAWNRTYNSFADVKPDRVPIVAEQLSTQFKGKDYKLRDVQLNFISSFTARGVGCAVHEVGLGKTMTGIIATVNNMLLGRCQKPVVVVPTSVLAKWEAEFKSLYPNVPLNVIGTPELNKRVKAGQRFEVPEASVTLLSYDAFQRFSFSKERFEELTKDLKDQISNPDQKASKRKDAADTEKAAGIASKAVVGSEDALRFDEAGFDHICVDEAHNFNNIFLDVKSEGRGGSAANEFQGIVGGGSASNRGIKLWLAARHILRQNNNRNVLLLTATPFTNNPLQVYSLLSVLAKERLEKLGIRNVRDFVAAFVETQHEHVMEGNGDVVSRQTVRRFQNGHAFSKLINEFFDRRTGEEAGVERPELIERDIVLPMTKEMEGIRDRLEQLYDGIFTAEKDGKIMLADQQATGGEALKSMMLQQLQNVSPALVSDKTYNARGSADFVGRSPKLQFVTRSVSGFFQEFRKRKPDTPVPGQIIFLPRGVDYFETVKKALVAQGVPEDAIQLMRPKDKTDRALDPARARQGVSRFTEIMEDFNNPDGRTKIIIGSDTIQEGVDLNGNTAIGYNCMLDWNPTSNEQKKGRGWRYGNRQKRFHMFYPLIENSIDTKLYQKHAEKVSRINDIFKSTGKPFIETADINPDEIKLDLIRDPARKARMKVRQESTALAAQVSDYKLELAALKTLEDKIRTGEREIEDLIEEVRWYEDYVKSNPDDSDSYYAGELKTNRAKLAAARRRKELREELMENRGWTPESIAADIERYEAKIAATKLEIEAITKKTSEYVERYTRELAAAQATRKKITLDEIVDQHVSSLVDSVAGADIYKSRAALFRLSVQKSVLQSRHAHSTRRTPGRPAARRIFPARGAGSRTESAHADAHLRKGRPGSYDR